MKSTRYLVAVPAALALTLAGCGGTSGNTESPAASGSAAPGAPTDDSNCADEAVFCIGLVTDTGKVDDKSFNQSAHEGALAAAEQTQGFYKYIETQDAKDYADWNLGVALGYKALTFSIAYVDSSLSQAELGGSKLADAAVLFTVSAAF